MGEELKSRKAYKPTRIIAGSFLMVILLGALLLTLPISSRDGQSAGFLGALFTATSATCVTGLIVFDTYTQFTPFGQAVILMLIQIGGLGLVTLTTFFNVLIGRRLGFRSLQLASESISVSDKGQARTLLHTVIRVAITCELLGMLLLLPAMIPKFGVYTGTMVSIFLSVSAFCNAGFDIMGRIAPYTSLTTCFDEPYVLAVIAALIICGGLGFLVWQDIAAFHKTKHLRVHTRLVLIFTAALLIFGTVSFAVCEWNNPATLGNMNVLDKISNSAFQSATLRTAGFNSVDLAACQPVTKIMMILLMFIGAAPGGTGGGIKVTTFAVLFMVVASVVRGREDAAIFKHKIPKQVVYKALALSILSLIAVVISTLTINVFTSSDVNIMDSMFEAVSAFATVGLSVGATAVMKPIALCVTMATMLIGRVGPVTMAISFSLNRDHNDGRAVMPKANISVG